MPHHPPLLEHGTRVYTHSFFPRCPIDKRPIRTSSFSSFALFDDLFPPSDLLPPLTKMSDAHGCHTCSINFRNRSHLRRHMARFHEPFQIRYPCQFPGCLHTTAQASNLRNHVKSIQYILSSSLPIAPSRLTRSDTQLGLPAI
ncbi:hypothetical protein BOTBODRAFT_496511 [Botryobasidium botryosum FD-172 SS1]|uniref:C2H2-type domain-containing protein n=1 Tax=Botryobasidium botryosum (strain FD-172 SS1) TaxID=930990 RepID=A0A067MEC2_BOTB1|nr:hypothetical protein BOTBODRAFT_496511 [Botryobasidium botryosum FD-172 SS1]